MVKGVARSTASYRDVRVTIRQAEILDLAARDLTDKQIAGRLGISVSTVRTQWQRFYKANGLHAALELLQCGFEVEGPISGFEVEEHKPEIGYRTGTSSPSWDQRVWKEPSRSIRL
jgi:DNA-binding CsgD family transcriptional regulator